MQLHYEIATAQNHDRKYFSLYTPSIMLFLYNILHRGETTRARPLVAKTIPITAPYSIHTIIIHVHIGMPAAQCTHLQQIDDMYKCNG